MNVYEIRTKKSLEFVNIDHLLIDAIKKSKREDAVAIIYTPHTTAAITINENADPDVPRDMIYGLSKIVPNYSEFLHYEGNSSAHIKSSLVGASEMVIIENKNPVLGRWQSVFFAEFDGPRNRKVIIKII